MPKQSMFMFVPEKQLTRQSKEAIKKKQSVTVDTKSGVLRFSMAYVREANLDRAFIKLYADVSTKTIGWRKVQGDISRLSDMKDLRQLKVYKNKKTGCDVHCQIGISSLLSAINVKPKLFSRMEIKQYKPGALEAAITYVTLK